MGENFIIRYTKICGVEPMGPGVGTDKASERFKIYLDGAHEMIVNGVVAADIIATISAMNRADCALFSKLED